MPNSVNNVKTEYTFETKKALAALSKLISGLKQLKGEAEKSPKISLEDGIKNAYKEIKSAKSAIAELTQKIKDQQNVVRGYEKSIGQMTKAMQKDQTYLSNTLQKWYEVGNAIGQIKGEQRATTQAVGDYQKQIDISREKIENTAKTLERLKELYGQFEEARANRDKAFAERDAYRDWRVSQMSSASPWYSMTPEQREDTLARDESMQAYNEAAREAYKTMSDLKGQIQEVTGMSGKVDDTFREKTEQLNTALREERDNLKEAEHGLRSSESALSKMGNQQANLERQARKLSASFREVVGSEAAMNQSSIDAYINEERDAIDKETSALEQHKTALEEDKNARDTLRLIVEGNYATIEQNKEALREEAEEQKRAAQAKKDFQRRLQNVGKAIRDFRKHISSAVNGVKNFVSSIKGAIPGANKFGGALGKLASQFKRLFVMRILRNAISSMIKGFQEGIQNVAKYSAALNNLDANHANQTMSELASTSLYLKNVLGSAAIPALNAILPVIRAIATGFATAVNYVNQFISALGGKSSWTRAKQVTVDYASSLGDVGSSAGSAKDAVDDLKRTILGFDEINKLNDANSSSGGSGGGSGGGGSDSVNVEDMFEEVPIENKVYKWLEDLKPYIDDIKDAWDEVKTSVKNLVESEGFKYLVGTVFKEVLLTIKDALLVISSIIDSINKTLNDPAIKKKIDDVAGAWDGVREAVKKLVDSSAWDAVVNTLTFAGLTVLETVLNSISGLIGGIEKGLEWLEQNGKISDLKDAFGEVGSAFSNLFNGVGFQDLTGTTLYLFITGITGALTGIKTVIDTVVTPVLNELSRNGTFSQIRDDWDKIWTSVDNISKSEVFQKLMKFTLKSALEGVAGVLKTIAGFLETIDGIVNGDTKKIGQGWRDFVSGITSALQPVFEGIDMIFGTNLGAQNKILTKALSEGISYKEAEILLKDPSDRIVENNNGDMWAVEQRDGTYSTISTRNTIYKELKEFQEEWAKLPSEKRSLAFDAFIDANAEQMAVIFKTEPWNELSQAEKQLAFDAYISTLPKDLADEFARTHGTAPSWANLSDEEKALAWIAYISSSGKLVADKFTMNEWNKLSDDQKILEFKGWIESTGTTVANAFKTDQWKGLSDADKKLLFNAGIGNSGTDVAKEYKDKKWATTSADARSLYFNAGINTTGASVAKDFINTKWAPVSQKSKLLPFDATITDVTNKSQTKSDLNKYMSDIRISAKDGQIFNRGDIWKNFNNWMSDTRIQADKGYIWNKDAVWKNFNSWMSDTRIQADGGNLWNKGDIWKNFNWWMSDTRIQADGGNLWNKGDVWKNFNWWMSDTHISAEDDNLYNRYEIYKNFSNYMDGVSFSAIAYVDPVLTGSPDFSTGGSGGKYSQFTGGIIGRAIGGINQRFFDSAQLFTARENGIPEYVGRFGSQSAVANNYQITEGIALGVQRATAVQNELLREQNALLTRIATQGTNVNVSSLLGALGTVNKRTGTPVVTMG